MFSAMSRSRGAFCTSHFPLFPCNRWFPEHFAVIGDKNMRNIYVAVVPHRNRRFGSFHKGNNKPKNIREISPFLKLYSPFPITSKSLKSPKSSIACVEPLLRDENLAETLENFNLVLNLFEQAPRVVHQISPDSTPPPEIKTFESGSNGLMLSIVEYEVDDLKLILFYVLCVIDKK